MDARPRGKLDRARERTGWRLSIDRILLSPLGRSHERAEGKSERSPVSMPPLLRRVARASFEMTRKGSRRSSLTRERVASVELRASAPLGVCVLPPPGDRPRLTRGNRSRGAARPGGLRPAYRRTRGTRSAAREILVVTSRVEPTACPSPRRLHRRRRAECAIERGTGALGRVLGVAHGYSDPSSLSASVVRCRWLLGG